mmetsp:Transcript_27497/g.69978  ORF Transcript_27497/g.69978 Transcript_27497/m.69978 type:complete len:236 (+) Transcript_27497:308-1015(+)
MIPPPQRPHHVATAVRKPRSPAQTAPAITTPPPSSSHPSGDPCQSRRAASRHPHPPRRYLRRQWMAALRAPRHKPSHPAAPALASGRCPSPVPTLHLTPPTTTTPTPPPSTRPSWASWAAPPAARWRTSAPRAPRGCSASPWPTLARCSACPPTAARTPSAQCPPPPPCSCPSTSPRTPTSPRPRSCTPARWACRTPPTPRTTRRAVTRAARAAQPSRSPRQHSRPRRTLPSSST